MAFVVSWDLLILAGIVFIFIYSAKETQKCSDKLYWAGSALCMYNIFFVIRNIFICATSYYSQNPVTSSSIARLSCIFVDCFAYTCIVVWATL